MIRLIFLTLPCRETRRQLDDLQCVLVKFFFWKTSFDLFLGRHKSFWGVRMAGLNAHAGKLPGLVV